MSQNNAAINGLAGSHLHPRCDIFAYTLEQIYSYYALAEMVYLLSSDEVLQNEIRDKIGQYLLGVDKSALLSWRGRASDDLLRVWSAGQAEYRGLSIAYLRNFQHKARLDASRAVSGPLKAAYDHLMKAERAAGSVTPVDFMDGLMRTVVDGCKALWRDLKEKYYDCGLLYAVAATGVDGILLAGQHLAFGAAGVGLRGLQLVARRVVDPVLKGVRIRVFAVGIGWGDFASRDFAVEALVAKYGAARQIHMGGYGPDLNYRIAERPAADILRERKAGAAGPSGGREKPGAAPSGAPDWVAGRLDGDPSGIYRAVDGQAALIDPVTGRWTVAKGLSPGVKGSFGEVMAQHDMLGQGHGLMTAPRRLGERTNVGGIDAIYSNANPPPPYIIAEVKFRSAGSFDKPYDAMMPVTKNGKVQMGRDWIVQRVEDAVGQNRALAEEIMDQKPQRLLQVVGPDGKVINIDLDTGMDIRTGEKVLNDKLLQQIRWTHDER